MLLKIIVAERISFPTTIEKTELVTMSIKSNDLKNKTKPRCFCNSSVLRMKVNLVCYVITNNYFLLINIYLGETF